MSSDTTPPPQEPQHGFLAACLRGDQDAWEALVRSYAGLVYTMLRRCGLSDAAAADAFQDVWIAAWKGLATVRDEQALKGWLATIAARTGMRALRHQIRGPLVGGEVYEATAARTADPAPIPEDTTVEHEQRETLWAAISTLSERDRVLVHAFFYDPTAPSYVQIAARLGVSPETVGPLRTRCLRRLRTVLGNPPGRTGTES